MELIPERLYENIKKLNKLRNGYAHKLDYDFLKSNLDFFDPDHPTNIKEIKKLLANNKKTSVAYKNALLWIGVLTFGWLNNHCKNAHGLK